MCTVFLCVPTLAWLAVFGILVIHTSVRAVFLCVPTMVWLPVLEIFTMHTYADACDWMQGWYKHPLPHQGIQLASALHLAFWCDTLPPEVLVWKFCYFWRGHGEGDKIKKGERSCWHMLCCSLNWTESSVSTTTTFSGDRDRSGDLCLVSVLCFVRSQASD